MKNGEGGGERYVDVWLENLRISIVAAAGEFGLQTGLGGSAAVAPSRARVKDLEHAPGCWSQAVRV